MSNGRLKTLHIPYIENDIKNESGDSSELINSKQQEIINNEKTKTTINLDKSTNMGIILEFK